MSKKKNKQERKKARHDRRVANRAKLKKSTLKLYAPDSLVVRSTIPAVEQLRAALSMTIPTVHTELRSVKHPTWDRLLNHLGRYRFSDRRAELRCWVQGLLSPTKPQPPLLLTGPECSGKTIFHQAMGLLLPDRAIVHYPTEARFSRSHPNPAEAWQQRLQEAWLMVVENQPDRFVNLFLPRKPGNGDAYSPNHLHLTRWKGMICQMVRQQPHWPSTHAANYRIGELMP